MTNRDKAIEAIFQWHNLSRREETILDLPEVAAYFRELIDNEPSGYVAERKCDYCDGYGTYGDDANRGETCKMCNGSRIISRQLTRKEVMEIPNLILQEKERLFGAGCFVVILPSGERVVKEEI